MAFVFNKIQEQLDQQDGQQGSNIFGGGESGGGAQGNGGQSIQLGSAEGDLSGSGTSGTQAPKQAAVQNTNAQLLEKNKAPNPENMGLVKNAKASVAKAQQGIQDEADQIAQGASAYKAQALSDEDLSKGITGPGVEKTKIAGALSQSGKSKYELPTTGVYNPQEDIKAAQTAAKTLGSYEGIQSQLQKDAQGAYTAGMSRLDTSLLRRSPQFQQIQAQLNADANALAGARTKAEQDAVTRGQADIDKSYADEAKRVNDYLTTQRGSLETLGGNQAKQYQDAGRSAYGAQVAAAKQRLDAENAKIGEIIKSGAAKGMRYDALGQDPTLSGLYNQQNRLIQAGAAVPMYNASVPNFALGSADAQKWNTINALLGLGTPEVSAVEQGAYTQNYDPAALDALIAQVDKYLPNYQGAIEQYGKPVPAPTSPAPIRGTVGQINPGSQPIPTPGNYNPLPGGINDIPVAPGVTVGNVVSGAKNLGNAAGNAASKAKKWAGF